MDLASRPRSGQRCLEYVLIFNKSTGSSKVPYLMIDPWQKTRLFPKINSIAFFPIEGLMGYRTVVLSNCLYVIGGKRWKSGQYVNEVWKYDPISARWTRCQPMTEARTRFSADVLNRKIYCVGGEIFGGRVTETAECYDPVTDEWSPVSGLPSPRADHASCVVKNRLYISGGIKKLKHQCSGVFLVYDYDIDAWTEPITDIELPQEREKHTMVSIGGRHIYFFGGRGFDQDNFREKDEAKVCSFDCRKRVLSRLDPCWDKAHPNMFHPRSNAGHIVLGKKVYLMGGKNFSKDQDVRTVEYYDVKRRKWRETFQLPEGVSYVNVDCCVLRVPTYNQDFNSADLYLYDKWLLW